MSRLKLSNQRGLQLPPSMIYRYLPVLYLAAIIITLQADDAIDAQFPLVGEPQATQKNFLLSDKQQCWLDKLHNITTDNPKPQKENKSKRDWEDFLNVMAISYIVLNLYWLYQSKQQVDPNSWIATWSRAKDTTYSYILPFLPRLLANSIKHAPLISSIVQIALEAAILRSVCNLVLICATGGILELTEQAIVVAKRIIKKVIEV